MEIKVKEQSFARPCLIRLGVLGIIILACCGALYWTFVFKDSPQMMLWRLSHAEQRCVQEVVGSRLLRYAMKDDDSGLVGVGYEVHGTASSYYAALVKVQGNDNCELEFDRLVYECVPTPEWTSSQCPSVFRHFYEIQMIELTNKAPEEVFVSFAVVGRGSGGRHHFYTRDEKGSFMELFDFRNCARPDSVTFVQYEKETRIVFEDDRLCSNFGSRAFDYAEYSLSTGKPVRIRGWSVGDEP